MGVRIEKVFDKNGKIIGQRIVNNSSSPPPQQQIGQTPLKSTPQMNQNGQILSVKAGSDGNRMPKSTPKVANLNSPQMAHQIVNGPNGQMFLVPANNSPKVDKNIEF